jgi:hypothetical protein
MNRRKMIGAAIGATFLGLAAFVAIEGHHAILRDDDYGEDDEDEGDRGAVARALTFAKVSLQQGLATSELEGQPISGKFEVDRGNFQLSVHTLKDGKFFEVLVDYSTGNIAKVTPITERDDLAAAQSHSAAMVKAKTGLREVVDKAIRETPGFRAVAVAPNLKEGRPVASVLFFKGEELKVVNQTMD